MKPLARRIARTVTTVIGCAAVTAAATLAVCAPRTTHADKEDQTIAITGGDINSYATMQRSEKSKTGWSLEIHMENPGDTPVTATVETKITLAEGNPQSRVQPAGAAVWRQREKVTLAAHESSEKTIDVPASIAKQLDAVERVTEKREKLLAFWNEKGDVPLWVWTVYNAPRAIYSAEATKVGA